MNEQISLPNIPVPRVQPEQTIPSNPPPIAVPAKPEIITSQSLVAPVQKSQTVTSQIDQRQGLENIQYDPQARQGIPIEIPPVYPNSPQHELTPNGSIIIPQTIPQATQQEIDLPFGEGEMFVSNSRLEGVAKCALMSALKLLKYRSKKAQPVMESGTAIHEGIYEFLRTGDVKRVRTVVENYYRPIVEKAEEVFPAYELHNILAIITEYCNRNANRNWPWLFSPEEIEVGFEVPLFGKVKSRGIMDILVRDKATSKVAWVDIKSTGKLDASKEKIWSMSTQFSQYTDAIEKIYEEEAYIGFVEGIHVTKLPTSKKKCPEHKVFYSKCSEQHANFKTIPVPQNPQKLANWKMTAIGLAQKLWALKKIVKDKSILPSIPNQGMFNMSCQYCEFKDYCELGRQERVLDTMYEVVDYDPFEGRPMIKAGEVGA